eukprot:scaffold12139_cov119-Skeletonema_marinoi.AAC.2
MADEAPRPRRGRQDKKQLADTLLFQPPALSSCICITNMHTYDFAVGCVCLVLPLRGRNGNSIT